MTRAETVAEAVVDVTAITALYGVATGGVVETPVVVAIASVAGANAFRRYLKRRTDA